MIDVTDIDCKEGDKAEIFGDHLPITVLSDILDTIPYEVLTGISKRVKSILSRIIHRGSCILRSSKKQKTMTHLLLFMPSGSEWIYILLITFLLVFGGKKIPELARGLRQRCEKLQGYQRSQRRTEQG